MTLEARALVWLAVQACEVHNGSFAESVTQFVPNLGACNMQSKFFLKLFCCICFRYIWIYMMIVISTVVLLYCCLIISGRPV